MPVGSLPDRINCTCIPSPRAKRAGCRLSQRTALRGAGPASPGANIPSSGEQPVPRLSRTPRGTRPKPVSKAPALHATFLSHTTLCPSPALGSALLHHFDKALHCGSGPKTQGNTRHVQNRAWHAVTAQQMPAIATATCQALC